MRTALAVVAAFMLGTIVPIAPAENAAAGLSTELPENCNGSPAIIIIDGDGGSQIAFYQGPVDDTVYVSWTQHGSAVLESTAPYVYAMGVYVYGSGDPPAQIGRWPIQAGGTGGGQTGVCIDVGERHEFYFDFLGGVVGRSVAGECSITFELDYHAEVGIVAHVPTGSVGMDWGVTVDCEASVVLESAIIFDTVAGYYHCPVASTCLLEIQMT